VPRPRGSGGGGGGGDRELRHRAAQQQMQQQLLIPDLAYVESRATAVTAIEGQIHELGAIFGK
jgi:hypothetical protein